MRSLSVPLCRPLLGPEEEEAAVRAIRSGWVTQGPEVEAFEKEFAAYSGAEYACAVSSCTAALHLALLACGVRPGDEVITVSHSFIATANSVRYCGALPVFADIQPGTFNINPSLVERLITERTRAILCAHQMGMPCDLQSILEIARRRSLPVIEDAACAIGSEILWKNNWERIGRPRGDIACFSFHPRKVVTTGDGGMLTTSDPEKDEKFRLLRQHGMSVPGSVRYKAKTMIFETYPVMGYNYRMTDIQAAVGREQLKRLPGIVERRRSLAGRYRELLADVPRLKLPEEPSWARSNWQCYCVGLPGEVSQLDFMQFMLDRGVSTRRGTMCSHREEPYRDIVSPYSLPESEHAQDHSIVIPLYPQMTTEEQEHVVDTLGEACREV